MALYNRVKVTITAGGTGNLTIGAPVGMFQGFGDAGVPTGTVVSYVIEDAVASAWEYGRGTYTAPSTFARTTVLATNTGGTTPISAGVASILFIDALAEDFASIAVGAPIAGGTNGRVLFDNGGTIGEAANLTYDGTAAVLRQLKFNGTTSGVVTVQAQAVAGTYSVTLPAALPTIGGQSLVSDTSGVLSWATDAVSAFNAAATYVTGDIVTQGGKIYSSIAGSAPAAWDATKWTEIGSTTLAATRVGFGSATNGLTGSADITWNDTAATGKTLTIGGTSTGVALVTNRDVTINTLTIGLGNGNVSTNTAVGFEALKATTKGSSVALGFRALAATQTGQSNTALGAYAMLQANGASNNVAVGTFAMYNKTFVGDGCVAMGYFALKDATTTTNTVCIGSNALPVLTGGNGIVAIGGEAGSALTGGNYHTFIGFGAATRCTGGVGNVAIGYNCLNGANTTTTVAIGTNAFTNLNDTVSHSASIAIGNNAGSLVASAVNSTLIGNNQLTTGATISNIVVISAGVTEKFGANSAGAFTVASAGSAALPAIINSKWDGTGTGGTGTGIWWPAANTIAVSTNGVEAWRVSPVGNVGIGTSPAASQRLAVAATDRSVFDMRATYITPGSFTNCGYLSHTTNSATAMMSNIAFDIFMTLNND